MTFTVYGLIPSFFQMAVDELLLPTLTVLAGVMISVVESARSGALGRGARMQDLVGTVTISSPLNKDWVEHKTIIEPLTCLKISWDK